MGVTPGPRVLLEPGFAITQQEVMDKIEGGRITERSSLVLEGQGLKIKNLNLDGSLVIRCCPECDVEVDSLVVENEGYELEELSREIEEVDDAVHIRGYTMAKKGVMEIIISDPGKY